MKSINTTHAKIDILRNPLLADAIEWKETSEKCLRLYCAFMSRIISHNRNKNYLKNFNV